MSRSLKPLIVAGDELFEGFFEWLEEQYDETSGGFFYARSSKLSGDFTPDIESTAQALNIVDRCGLTDAFDGRLKEAFVRFFQSRQDPETGYFYEPDPNMRLDDVMVGRAIGYSMHALRRFGAEPLYPLPNDRESAPSYTESPRAYALWLRSVSLLNSWRGCDRLCNSAPYLSQMDSGKREPFLKEAVSFFTEIQDPESGLWGKGTPYVRLSGTFKLHTFFTRFRVPMPRTSEIYRSILNILHNEEAIDMCYIRNPISLLASMNLEIPERDMKDIASITLANMAKLKRNDGGFSREITHSPAATNVAQVKPGEYYPDMPAPVPLGKGEVEGDMNAGTQAVLIRHLLYKLSGVEPGKLPVPSRYFSKYRIV
ncbi:hypothetical protein AB6A23_19705 [Paenibacillus tarimensis]